MLEKATVTLLYSEFQELLDKINNLEESINDLNQSTDEFADIDYKACFDKLIIYVKNAYECKDTDEKQSYIARFLLEYSMAFRIPLNEIMGDTSLSQNNTNTATAGGSRVRESPAYCMRTNCFYCIHNCECSNVNVCKNGRLFVDKTKMSRKDGK